MKRSFALIVTLLLSTAIAAAQVQEFQIGAQQNSIIRTVDDEHVLIYTQNADNQKYFLLCKRGSNTAQAFQVPNLWEVRDVRIHNGSDAYFCGTNGVVGMVGMFNINSLFSGTEPLNYSFFSWSPAGYVLPTDLKRLKLYEVGGRVNMAMTGSSLWNIAALVPNTTVVSACLNGGGWDVVSYINKDMEMAFTDVACLESVIVAVGTDSNGEERHLITFEKTTGFPQFPTDCPSPASKAATRKLLYTDGGCDPTSLSNIQLTRSIVEVKVTLKCE